MERSCRREPNFVKCCKMLAYVKNDKIALSCRRERKNAQMAPRWTLPGEAKIELSCRRELNFAKCTKTHANMPSAKVMLSCRRERKNARMASGGNPPGKAKMELSCRRELNFVKFGKNACQRKQKVAKSENSALVQARAPNIGPWGHKNYGKMAPTWIQNRTPRVTNGPRGVQNRFLTRF